MPRIDPPHPRRCRSCRADAGHPSDDAHTAMLPFMTALAMVVYAIYLLKG